MGKKAKAKAKAKAMLQAEAMLQALKEPVPLSTNKGNYLGEKVSGVNKKTKRHSGRYTPRRASKLPQSEMIENAEEPQEAYDDWMEYRDGLRFDPDSTHLRSEQMSYGMGEQIRTENKKIIHEREIRKAKLDKKKLKKKVNNNNYDKKKNRMAQGMYKM